MDASLKFQSADFTGQDVESLPDVPSEAGYTAAQLKARFDNVGKALVALGKHNDLVDALSARTAAAGIGAVDDDGNPRSVQDLLDALEDAASGLQTSKLNKGGHMADKALVTDANGNVSASFTPRQAIEYISNLRDNAQEQIDLLSNAENITVDRVDYEVDHLPAFSSGDTHISNADIEAALNWLSAQASAALFQTVSGLSVTGDGGSVVSWTTQGTPHDWMQLLVNFLNGRIDTREAETAALQSAKASKTGWTPSRVLVSDGAGALAASGVAAAKLGYIGNLTSDAQAQLNAKAAQAAVDAALAAKQDMLRFDAAPAFGSTNPVTSEGIRSAVAAAFPACSAQGAVASFADGADRIPMKSVFAGIAPVQNLNGHDCPWAGGAGKNLLENTGSASATSHGVTFTKNADGSVTANGTNDEGGSSLYRIPVGLPAGDYLFASGITIESPSGKVQCIIWDDTDGTRAKKWDGTTQSDGAIDALLHEVKLVADHQYYMNCYILSGQTADNIVFDPMLCASTETDPDFEPYENICPIIGYTGATAYRAGSNCLNYAGAHLANVSKSGSEDHYTLTVLNSGLAILYYVLPDAFAGKTLYLSGTLHRTGSHLTNIAVQLAVRGSDGVTTYSTIAQFDQNGDAELDDVAVSIPSSITNIRIRIIAAGSEDSSAEETTTVENLHLCVSEGEDWAPYTADSYPVSWQNEAGTVYGGTIDFVSGTLTVTKRLYTYSGAIPPSTIAAVGSLTRFWIGGFTSKKYVNGGALCDSLRSLTNASYDSETVGVGNGAPNYPDSFWIKLPTALIGSTAESIAAYFAENPIDIVYDLAAPVTVQLAPQEIDSLPGENNVWTDIGNVDVIYRADPALVIGALQARVAALEDGA